MPYVTTPPQPSWHQPSPIALGDVGRRLKPVDLGRLDLVHCASLGGEYVEKQKLDEGGTLAVYPDFKVCKPDLKKARFEFDGLSGGLLGVHAHASNEHSLAAAKDGDPPLGEIHFVFGIEDSLGDASTLFVAGVLIRMKKERKPPVSFGTISSMPVGCESTVKFGAVVKHIEEHGRYVYDGSLTSPPYTETVQWCVADEAMDEPDDEPTLSDFLTLCAQPARTRKKLGRRFVVHSPGNNAGEKPKSKRKKS